MRETIEQLKELLGSDFALLVSAFDQDNRVHLNSLEGLISSGDHQQVSREAHSIKGASSNLGALELADLCQQLESSAKQGDLSRASDLLEKIKVEFEIVIEVLKSA